MSAHIIDLQVFRTAGSKVFTGRDRGEQVRINSHIDTLVDQHDKLSVKIPEGIYSINPSFLEEFLVNVVLKLGKQEFSKKVEFISQGNYDISKDLLEAVDRITRTENALV